MREPRLRCWPALLTVLLLTSCSAPKSPGATPANPAALLQAIPDARPDLYRNMKDMKNWRNPYLIIRKDTVALLDINNNEEKKLKPEEVASVLAELPATAWPYGRVVAVQELGLASTTGNSEQDKVALRRTKGIVAGTLEELHVLIDWVPSA